MKTHILLMAFCMCSTLLKAQDSSNHQEPLLYKLTIGAGMGSGYPLQQDKYGLSGMITIALQHKKNLYGLGIKGLGEFQLIGGSYPSNTISSIDITYGKACTKGKIGSSVIAGLGYVTTLTKGKYLSSDAGLFGSAYYEKVRSHTIGLPVSARMFFQPNTSGGIGFEGYANFNSKNIFYGLNLAIELAIRKREKRKK